MLALALSLSLSATPAASPVDEVPWHEHAAGRFLGAFLGAVAGMAAPMAITAAATSCGGFSCRSTLGEVVGATTPALGALGAAAGLALAGGSASIGTALGLASLGALVAEAVLLSIVAASPFATQNTLAAVLAAAGIGAGFEAFGLVLRDDVAHWLPDVAVPAGRLALEALSFFGALFVGGLLAVLPGFSSVGSSIASFILGTIVVGLSPLAPYAVHRANGGKGTVGAAYVGLAAILAVTLVAMVGVGVASGGGFLDGRRDAVVPLAAGGIALAVTLSVPLFLEASHGNAMLAPAPPSREIDDLREE